MKFLKQEWHWLGQWIQPTLSACFWDNWMHREFPFICPRFHGNYLMLDGHSLVRKADMMAMKGFIASVKGSDEILNKLQKWIYETHYSCKRRVALKFDDCSNEISGYYVKALKNFKELYADFNQIWIFMLLITEVLTEDMKELCKIYNLDFDKVCSLVSPIDKCLAERQIIESKRLYNKIKRIGFDKLDFQSLETIKTQFPHLADEITQHVNEFQTCGIHHFVGNPYTFDTFAKNFEGFEINDCYKYDETENSSKNKNELLQKLPNELRWYIKLASIASFGRMHMAETSGYVQHKITPLLLDVNKKLCLEENEYLWLSLNELINGLENPQAFVKPNIMPRKNKVGVFLDEKGNEIILADKDAEEVINALVETNAAAEFPLKGRVASVGRAIGRAKIILKPEDTRKMQPSDILVAHETSPDFVPAMKIAGAIVTEGGGITSHAAIVSRELKVPCIIGVKHATKIIKDDQEIEVDAENGIVDEVKKIL